VFAGLTGNDDQLGDVEAESDSEETQDDWGEFAASVRFWIVGRLHWLDGKSF
jgi:hypothetical protein